MKRKLLGSLFAVILAVTTMVQTVGAADLSTQIHNVMDAKMGNDAGTESTEASDIHSGTAQEVFYTADQEVSADSIQTPTLPVTLAPEATVTETSAYNAMIALKAQYPEGMPWTNDNTYRWRGYNYPNYIYAIGGGCAGFAFILSDAAFGDLPARYVDNPTYDDIRVGDILRVNNDSHSVIVLEKYTDHIVIAEGNYNASIHWGRTMTKDETMRTLTNLTTRYPVGAAASSPKPEDPSGVYDADNVDVDKIVEFVFRLYVTCLGRIPDEDGWFDWSYQLAAGQSNGAEVAWGFFGSDEMINKNRISAQIRKARTKTIDWILSHTDNIPVMEGYGPEVSILRSAIIVKQLDDNNVSDDKSLNAVIDEISKTIKEAENQSTSLSKIYKTLCGTPFGMKKGTIPVYLAWCMRKNQDSIVLLFKGKEIPISGDTLSQIEAEPENYTLYVEKGTQEKESFLEGVISAFSQIDPVTVNNKCTFAAELLQTWFRGLSKFTRDHTMTYTEEAVAVSQKMLKFKGQLLQYDINPHAFLFTDIPNYFGSENDYVHTLEGLCSFASAYNSFITEVKEYLTTKTKQVFNRAIKGSLSSIMQDWYNSLPETTRTHIFSSEVNGFLHFIKENTSFDDYDVISELAKCVTMLAIEDWNDQLVDTFLSNIKSYIDVVNSFALEEDDVANDGTIVLSLGYGGKVYENNITDTEISGIAETAMNNIESHLEEYGEAITAQERVAVLLKLLKKELEQL